MSLVGRLPGAPAVANNQSAGDQNLGYMLLDVDQRAMWKALIWTD